MRLQNKNVLVTGGCGLVGSHISEKCLKEGAKVRIIDNLSTGDISNITTFINEVEFIKGDIRDIDIVNKSLENIDIVFHEAAHLNPAKAISQPMYDFDVNLKGTLNLLISSIDNEVSKFIMASTYVHGRFGGVKISEDFSTLFYKNTLLTPYSAAKVSSEAYLKVFNDEMNLPTVRLRYTNVYGPKQRSKSESGVIALFCKWALNDHKLVIYGDGNQKRDFVYVDDVVEANILASISEKANGEVFNIGFGEETSIIHIANKVKEKINPKVEIVFDKNRPADFMRANIDISRSKMLLGYSPKICFETGFERYRDWCFDNIHTL